MFHIAVFIEVNITFCKEFKNIIFLHNEHCGISIQPVKRSKKIIFLNVVTNWDIERSWGKYQQLVYK